MRITMHFAALVASGLLPSVMAMPFRDGSESSASSVLEPSTYPYTPSSSASVVSADRASFSISFGTGSWSSFPTSVVTSSDGLNQSPPSSSLAPYGSIGPAEPSYTVVVESFTIPITPHATATPKPVSSHPVSSHPVASRTPSTVTATVTVPFESGSTTVVHTFTITESAVVSSPLVSPLPSASLSLDSSVLSKLSRSAKSASSLGNALRSIFSDIDGSQSGVGPVVVPNSAVSTKPGANKGPISMITASFTLTLPTSTFFVPILPTYTGSMITADFTLTLPPPPKSSEEGTKTSTIPSSSDEWTTVTESCTSSTTSTSSCEETPAPTLSVDGLPEILTYTLSTKVTLTLDNTKTTTCASETGSAVPSGSDAITLTYTLPGGPGRASQTVTITTVRPTPKTSVQSGPSSSLPSGASSGIWSTSNSSFISGPTAGPTAGPTGTGSIPFPPVSSLSPSHVIPSPAISGVIIITETKTYTQVHTATLGAAKTTAPKAHTSLVVGNPRHNVTTFAPVGTAISTGTGTGGVGPTFSAHGPFANATGSLVSQGVPSPTNGVLVPDLARREAECNRSPESARIVLNFDDAVIQNDESLLAPNTHGFANPDQGLQFSGGFERVVYSSSSRFIPSSMPAMLRFDLPATTNHGAVNGMAKIGAANSCSRFNLVSWNLGCDSTDAPCHFNVTGFRLAGGEEVMVGSKVFVVPQAAKTPGNALHQIVFGTDDFSKLSSFTIQLESEGSDTHDQAWWSDDLSIARVCSGTPLCATVETADHGPDEDVADIVAGKVAEKEKAAPFWHRKTDLVV